MLNSILQDQISDAHILQFKAQKSLYSRSKVLRGLQVVFAIPIALGCSITASLFPKFQIWAALCGLIVTVLDASVVDMVQENWRRTAASIQELFDCEVLRIDWNEALTGSKPAPEIISRYSQGDQSSIQNWYPVAVGDVPLDAARIICQRSNASWDAELRRRYNILILSLLTVAVLTAFFIGLLKGMTLQYFLLTILAPFTPSFRWVIKEYRAQCKAAEASDRLRTRSDELWGDLLSGAIQNPGRQSRLLQDNIFENRRNSPPIFDWIYNLLRKSQEEQMNYAATELVRQFQCRSQSTSAGKL